ncbi:MAG: MCE family protein [Myxococcales bacterium]|nr:MCE family protein [Myxococcales bacterium]
MRYEVGVGGLLLVASAMTGLMALEIGALDFGDSVDVTVPMADAAGLSSGADVKVAGVSVGVVGDMFLAGDQAMVTLNLEPGAKIRRNVAAKVRMESLLGTKYVELVVDPAGPEEVPPLLMDGDVLDPVPPQYEVDELVEALGRLLEAMDPEQLAHAVRLVTQSLEEDPEQLARILSNLDRTLANSAAASEQLPTLAGDLRVTLATTRATLRNLETRSMEAGHVLARTDRVMASLEASAAPLPETVREARRVLDEARQVVSSIDAAATSIQGTADGFSIDTIERVLQEEGIRIRLSNGRWDKKRQ